MTTEERTSAPVGVCPRCEGVIAWSDGSWACEDCRFVPNHGAD